GARSRVRRRRGVLRRGLAACLRMTASRHRGEFLAGMSAFLLASLGLLYYALRGDSYDLVVRQEEAIAVALVLGLGGLLALLPRARLPRGWWLPVGAL